MTTASGVYVIGAGGHGKVVVRLLQELGHHVAAVFDDDPRRWQAPLLGVPVLGPVTRIEEHPRLPAVIAVGDNAARRQIAERYPLPWLTAVHPRAIVDRSVRLGRGTVVLPGAVIQVDACLGDHVIVNTAATVDHDCRIGDYAHLAPGSHLAGGVCIGGGVLVGIGAVAIPGITIGARTTVGAGAAVVCDLPSDAVAVGVPAKIALPAERRMSRPPQPKAA
jgi:sugar O-acyltransferase (sialic acid O-acetyltransferase NeuD family)